MPIICIGRTTLQDRASTEDAANKWPLSVYFRKGKPRRFSENIFRIFRITHKPPWLFNLLTQTGKALPRLSPRLCSRSYSLFHPPSHAFLLNDGLGTQCLARGGSCIAVPPYPGRMFESYCLNGYHSFHAAFPPSASQSMGSGRLCDGG